MSTIKISVATKPDFQTLQKIAKETFYEAYAASNSSELLENYMKESFSEEKLITELENPHSLFYLAWDKQLPIGYLKLNRGDAQTDLQERDSLEIERIYVKAEYHGKKVGQMLCDKAVEVAIENNKKSIWLGVWEENLKAIRFYEKNGFLSFGKHFFQMGNEEQTDMMMRKAMA